MANLTLNLVLDHRTKLEKETLCHQPVPLTKDSSLCQELQG